MPRYAKVFIDKKGEPIRFFVVTGRTFVSEEGGLEAVRAKEAKVRIERHGGKVSDRIEDADVWIVNDGVLDRYKRYCAHDPNHRAEGTGFIQKCIERKSFQDELLEDRTTMHGRHPGRRSHYTDEEEETLCQWIAMKVPEMGAGGRFGVKIYEQLVAHGEEYPEGLWRLANNHPMQSWKERYKKNSVRLDGRIDTIITEKGYTVESKAAYRSDRRLNKRARAYALEEEEEEEDPDKQGEFATSENEEEFPPPRKRQKHFEREEGEGEEEEDPEPDIPESSGRGHSPAVEAGEKLSSPPNTQRTLVNPTQGTSVNPTPRTPVNPAPRTPVNPMPRTPRTYSRRTDSDRRPRVVTEVRSQDEASSTAQAAAASSSRVRPAIARANRRSPSVEVVSYDHRASSAAVRASRSPSGSLHQVVRDLDENELENAGSFTTDTDDARARDGLFEDAAVFGSDDPFEVSTAEDN